jgi:hypothetical protein
MGRPKIDEKDKKISINITLQREQVEILKELGNGNASEAVRKLISLIAKK